MNRGSLVLRELMVFVFCFLFLFLSPFLSFFLFGGPVSGSFAVLLLSSLFSSPEYPRASPVPNKQAQKQTYFCLSNTCAELHRCV